MSKMLASGVRPPSDEDAIDRPWFCSGGGGSVSKSSYRVASNCRWQFRDGARQRVQAPQQVLALTAILFLIYN
jgi:hypothetical protein